MEHREETGNVERELEIRRKLSQMWSDVYEMKEELGEGHELYNGLDELTGHINHMECNLIRYIKERQTSMNHEQNVTRQTETPKHKPMKR